MGDTYAVVPGERPSCRRGKGGAMRSDALNLGDVAIFDYQIVHRGHYPTPTEPPRKNVPNNTETTPNAPLLEIMSNLLTITHGNILHTARRRE